MLKSSAITLFLVSLFGLVLQAQNESLMPTVQGQLVQHSAYSLDYNESQEQAYWVFYELSRAELHGPYERSDNFKSDPLVPTGSAAGDDYRYSGYDRGHLAPAADMSFSAQAMAESFYMSNMSPQEPGFNRGIWKRLEAQLRAWAEEDGDLYIVSGPLFLENRGNIGGGVAVPSHFFKIVLDSDAGDYRSLAFILPNQKASGDLQAFERSIDEVESLSRIDFFAALPDSLEKMLEAKTTGSWDYSLRFQNRPSSRKSSSAQQCEGQTQSGRRCKRRTTNTNGYCWQHQEQHGASPALGSSPAMGKKTVASQCRALTQSGRRCKRKTKNSSGLCWQHD